LQQTVTVVTLRAGARNAPAAFAAEANVSQRRRIMKLYCYGIHPIDFWFGAQTGKQLVDSAWQSNPDDWASISRICLELSSLKNEADAAFKTMGCDDEIRDGPYYFAIPGDTELLIGYIVKQDNNGYCYVASPCPLSTLDGPAFETFETE
jgi:hypothetical protein